MAQLPQPVDLTQIAPAQAFDPVPAGKYLMHIRNSEMKSTSSGNGSYLQLENEILDGPSKGRVIFERLNIDNPNQSAVEIAYRTLSAIGHAVGVMNVADSGQLHNKPFIGIVKVKPASGNYDAGNEMKGYEASSSAQIPASGPAAAAAQTPAAAAPAASSTPPWMRTS